MVEFYASLIQADADLAVVVNGLKKIGVPITWRAEHQAAFVGLKQSLCGVPVF